MTVYEQQLPGQQRNGQVSGLTALRSQQSNQDAGSGDSVRTDPRSRALTSREVTAVKAVAAATLLLGVIGLVNSFHAVAEAAQASFGGLAWTVPLAVDVGILVFSALDLVLARLDMRVAWLRLLPWSLVAVTIYLNVADEPTWFGRIAHAVLPALWVVAVEVGTHAVRIRAGLGSMRRMDRIRTSRWLLAPASTVGLWRRMVLWEIRSYPDALTRERDRLLALTRLQDAYGRIGWRWNAPRRERALYRLGEHTPTGNEPATTPQLRAANGMGEASAAPRKASKSRRKPAGRKPATRKLLADYVSEARTAWTPDIEVTPAWVRSVTDCARGTSKAVADALRAELSSPTPARSENAKEIG